jgi:hypothetical protein
MMKGIAISILLFSVFPFIRGFSQSPDSTAVVPKDSVASTPFAFGDFSWLNGTSRKTSPPAFDSKYFTGDITFDFNSTHSFNNPIDNTVVGFSE